jgi:hypothetical protein
MLVKIEPAANGLIVTGPDGAVHVLNGHAEVADELERARVVAQELGQLALELVAQPQPETVTEPAPEIGDRARERQAQELRDDDHTVSGSSLEDVIEETISKHGAKLATDFMGFLRGVSMHGDRS